MSDTVRIEYMMLSEQGIVIMNWTTAQGGVENNPQIYVPRALDVKRSLSPNPSTSRVRVISEQTNRIVDMFP